MQKILKTLFAFGTSVIFLTNVSALTCTNSESAEINSLVSQIRGSYEIATEEVESHLAENGGKALNEYFKLSIVNLTDKFYLKVTNDYDDFNNIYTYENSQDSIVSFNWEDLSSVVKFKIEIYTSDKTGCPNELVKTIYVTTPRFNIYSEYAMCEDVDLDVCQKYVTFKDVDESTITQKINKYFESMDAKEKNENKNIFEKIKDFIVDNKYYFIGGGVGLIVVAGVAVAVIVKKQRSSEL